ncbi:tetratricopeptide repeat protein [Thermodesulfovibrio yellowstonii]|uniref:tetratricopeptide repeat protein n=1 Tax=Thermodesulfovibrio yellowstonii TaxID=28262 RepID=UPI003C79C88C
MFKRNIINFIFLILLFLIKNSFAYEPVVIIADGEYVMGAGESMEISEEKAKRIAVQKAAEQAGAYVKSYTKVKNLALESDVIEVIANHAMKIEVLDRKKTVVGDVDAIKFYVKIKATMSQEDIEANLKKVRQDQSIVEEYNRLKADFDKQNREMEKLKRQLELATGGDKQKIAKLISEEEKKYKANLWLERAQQKDIIETEEAIKAYKKALELNPDIPQAYFGLAKTLYKTNVLKYGLLEDDTQKEKLLRALKDALENINRAISLDENYADAYALRAEILSYLGNLEDIAEKKDYNDKILKDINRALALNASNKAELYYLRASMYLDELQNAELEQAKADQFDYRVIEEYFNKALNEIDNAGSLCKEEKCLAEHYRRKAYAYIFIINYYLRREDIAKTKEFTSMREKLLQKADEIEKRKMQQEEKFDKEVQEQIKDLYQTEFGKIVYELEKGWKEKVTGISLKDLEEKSREEQQKIFNQIETIIRQKISSGKASAEEYILMSYFEENPQTKKAYFDRGIALYEKRNSQGVDAILLVQFYLDGTIMQNDDVKLNYLNKAKAVVDRNFAQAQKILSMDEFRLLISEMEKAKSDIERFNVVKKLAKLNRQQAEAFHWLQFAFMISHQKAEIYERLDLPLKALEEYLYLCKTFKIDEACKNAERLKK